MNAALLWYVHHLTLQRLWGIAGSSRTFLLGVKDCGRWMSAAPAGCSSFNNCGSAFWVSSLHVKDSYFQVLQNLDEKGVKLHSSRILHDTFSPGRLFLFIWTTPSWSNFRTANRLSNMLSSVWRKIWCPIKVLHKKTWFASLWTCFYRGKTLSSVLLGQKGHTAHEDWQELHSSDSPQCKILISGTIVYAI